MNIAIIDKAPSRVNYSLYFPFKYDLMHMSSIPIPSDSRFTKKMIDLDVDLDLYDLVILVGSEASKEYAKVTSVTSYSGQLINDKFVCLTNPAILIFKPEGKKDFDKAVAKIIEYANGNKLSSITGDYKGIDSYSEAEEFLLEVLHCNGPYVAMDSEGTALAPRDGHVIGISISHKSNFGRYITTDILDDHLFSIIQLIIDKYPIIFHNMKYDIKMIEYHTPLKFNRSKCHDTMVMHYVLDENDQHGLKYLALKYTNFGDYDSELDEFKVNYCNTHGILQDDFTYDLIPFPIISTYASIDTAVAFELAGKFLPIITDNSKLSYIYNKILIPGTHFLNEMEEVGIPIDINRMKAAGIYLNALIEEQKAKLYEFEEVKLLERDQGKIFNPNSVVQLRTLLFDYIGLTPTGKLTAAGKISTDAEVLLELGPQHPIPETILNIRKYSKILNTYINKILPELDRDGRIRTNFNLVFTTSGRLSSSGKFNAQQIPRDDPIIKGCIVAPEGYSIVSQDLVTGEMYYAAVLSGDTNLQQVFKLGGDFHGAIAKMVFNLPCHPDEVKAKYPALRQSAKAISFGILYGSGARKVADTVSAATGNYYSLEQAQEDINSYFSKFKKLKTWLESRKDFIKTNGYTYSFFGRKRRLLNVFSADKGIASHEIRSGINSEIQSLCSDVNLLGAIEANDLIKTLKLDAKIFALVHDSIVALVKDEHIEEYCKIIAQCTQKDRGCSITGHPIGVDQEIGKDYSFGKFDKTYKLEGSSLSRISS